MKPLLAATIKDVEELSFPMYSSPKLDGIRCLIYDGEPVTRTLKPIPNKYIRDKLSNIPGIEGMDGELIVGSPTDPRCFNITQSAVMTKTGTPDFTFYVFDLHNKPELPFHQRLFCVCGDVLSLHHCNIQAVAHHQVNDAAELLITEDELLSQGYEGVMVRDANALYKYGRSTLKQAILLKLKRFIDSEAKVIGFKEMMHNANKATTDALGRTERSSHKAGKVGMDCLGALQVVDIKSGVEFEVGTGFSMADRVAIWEERDVKLLGRFVKYKSFPVGVKEAPRFPVFLGFRDRRDMS